MRRILPLRNAAVAFAVLVGLASSSACTDDSIGNKLRVETGITLIDASEQLTVRFINLTGQAWRVRTHCGFEYERPTEDGWAPIAASICDGSSPLDSIVAAGDTISVTAPFDAFTEGQFGQLRGRSRRASAMRMCRARSLGWLRCGGSSRVHVAG